MRKMLAAVAILIALPLGACNLTTGGIVLDPATSAATDQIISQVQTGAQKVCSFVPTVETVSGILATFVTGGSAINALVSGIVNSICAAVAPKASLKRRAVAAGFAPTVRGVKVEGYFTR